MILRYYIFFIIFLLPFQVKSQPLISRDTVKINEVIISGKKVNDVLPGFRMVLVDSSIMKKFSHGTVAEAISYDSPIYIKNYGAGGTATSSLRGTGASGTQVTWNGMIIDNPMLGQSDLSIFSAGITDKIEIYYGGASMEQYSGASGGLISLTSKPSFIKQTSISLKPAIGSFGKYSGQVMVETGTTEFQSVTRAFYQEIENNFSYINKVSGVESFRDTRKNNEISQKAIIQEFHKKTQGGLLSAHFWYQLADRNLPSSIISEYAGESQNDESLRTIVSYEGGSGFSIAGSWMNSALAYHNSLARIESRNRAQGLTLRTKFKRQIGNKARLGFSLNEQYTRVGSNNYSGRAERNSADGALSIENLNSERIKGSFLIRQTLFNKKFLTPDFSAGIRLKPVLAKDYFLRYNVSRSSRIPTMNDLHWNPGGNPDLKNEYALLSELSLEMEETLNTVSIHSELALFRNLLKDMIVWRPGEFSYWSASNLKNVTTKGIETSSTLRYKSGNLISALRLGYSYTIAMDSENSQKQLIYVPGHMANGSLQVKYGMFYSSWLTNVTGLRYTSESNQSYLPSYAVSSFTFGIEHVTGWGNFHISFDIDNIFNADYQNIAYYPLPGRSFELRLLAQTNFIK